jgi:hypothetical protein
MKVEHIYNGRDNTIEVQLAEDGVVVALDTVYRVTARFGTLLIDYDAISSAFDWVNKTNADGDILVLMMGGVGIPAGNYQAEIVTYDTANPQGVAWPSVPVVVHGETSPFVQLPIGQEVATGPQGIQGEQGLQGPQGETGLQGPQGDAGPQGIQGDTGAQGLQGIPGDDGATGPQGSQGDAGSNADVTTHESTYAHSLIATAIQPSTESYIIAQAAINSFNKSNYGGL